ncbi:MAG: hypothetical protein KGI80_05300 [Verrucomicrobiota bacterium]|nr:hypothetical protein [Verrucomicrobiota bacterium]
MSSSIERTREIPGSLQQNERDIGGSIRGVVERVRALWTQASSFLGKTYFSAKASYLLATAKLYRMVGLNGMGDSAFGAGEIELERLRTFASERGMHGVALSAVKRSAKAAASSPAGEGGGSYIECVQALTRAEFCMKRDGVIVGKIGLPTENEDTAERMASSEALIRTMESIFEEMEITPEQVTSMLGFFGASSLAEFVGTFSKLQEGLDHASLTSMEKRGDSIAISFDTKKKRVKMTYQTTRRATLRAEADLETILSTADYHITSRIVFNDKGERKEMIVTTQTLKAKPDEESLKVKPTEESLITTIEKAMSLYAAEMARTIGLAF